MAGGGQEAANPYEDRVSSAFAEQHRGSDAEVHAADEEAASSADDDGDMRQVLQTCRCCLSQSNSQAQVLPPPPCAVGVIVD